MWLSQHLTIFCKLVMLSVGPDNSKCKCPTDFALERLENWLWWCHWIIWEAVLITP